MRKKLDNRRRYPKRTLLAILRHEERKRGWVTHVPKTARRGAPLVDTSRVASDQDPRIKYTREELIGEILEVVYPDVCRYHEEVLPCRVCAPTSVGTAHRD
jgi:hypothetical protein